MKQDKQLKEILLNSTDGSSTHFTNTVMEKIYSLKTVPYYYKPMLSRKLEKGFVFAFVAIGFAIIVLCCIIALTKLKLAGWLYNIPLPDLNYNQVLQFIFIFWVLFVLNRIFKNQYRILKTS